MLIKIFNNWLDIIVAILILLVFSKVLTFIIEKVVKAFTRRTKTKLDDLLIDRLGSIIVWLFFFIGIRAFILPLLDIPVLNKLNDSIIIILITIGVIGVFDVLIEHWGKKWATKTKATIDDALLPLFHNFSRIGFAVIGFILILHVWKINITPFLASLGVAGIVLAFALQNTLGNVFGGISLILDKNFKVGDLIKLSSGESGTIIDVGIRSTKLQTFDNELLIIPNGKLADSIIRNFAQPDLYARIKISCGVEYNSDIDKVRKLILDTLNKMPVVIKKDNNHPIQVLFNEMGDFALKFDAIFWVKDYNQRIAAKSEATENLYKALTKSKVGIPFPTQTVYIKK